MRKSLKVFFLVICSALTIFSGYMVCSIICEYKEAVDAYDELNEFVSWPEQTVSETEPPEHKSNAKPEEPIVVLPAVDFDALRERAPDIIAWLTMPNTNINYPVVQADNNDYYLRRLYNGVYNQAGCLFADYRCASDLSGRNTIIYGHNMRDGSMFSELKEYLSQSYYETHPTICLITPNEKYIAEIFTVFTASPQKAPTDASPWRINWSDDADFTVWVNHAAEQSVVRSNITVNSNDRILTLSTCTDNGKERFIVMGKMTPVNKTE